MQFFLEFLSQDALRAEIEENLRKGRVYIAEDHDVTQGETASIVVIHPISGEWLPLEATVVFVAQGETPGVGFELSMVRAELESVLFEFLKSAASAPISSASGQGADIEAEPSSEDLPQSWDGRGDRDSADDFVLEMIAPSVVPPSFASEECEPSSGETPRSARSLALSPAERVRALDAAGREKVARKGQLADRVALERAYGASVWEPLLSNPLLTGAEVARIAKNGNISQPILTLIVSTAGWLNKAEVRRALLSNPRLSEALAERVLRALPANELKLVPRQSGYPAKVRNIAKRMLI